MATEILAGLRVEKSEENPYGWMDVDLRKINLEKPIGYQSSDVNQICKQLCAVSIVPQDRPKKYGFSKIGFASMDDYHYDSEDAVLLTNEYELDCNETSVIGIVERQRECREGISRLMYIDNLLDYNSIEDKHNVWLGRTEKLHQMDVYTDMNYQNEFGIKSKDAENFSLMIARALQNAVSNSCENKESTKLIELDLKDIFKNRKAAYQQGTQDLNSVYLYPDVENIAQEAQERGAKIDEFLYPQAMSLQSFQASREI